MFNFRQSTELLHLPPGFLLETQKLPDSRALNKLLSSCKEATHPPEKLQLACKRSLFHVSIIDKLNCNLVGFVRATSDHGLNANLWNLVAQPGNNQQQFLAVLVGQSLETLRRELPGCSISVSAPLITIKALEEKGFLLNPNGIRAMGLSLT